MEHIELFQDAPRGDSVRLTWCLSREALDAVKRRGGKEPHMLLVTVEKDGDGQFREVGRRAAPLSDGSAYPEFLRPGRFAVLPVVVEKRELEDLMRRRKGRYVEAIVDSDGRADTGHLFGQQLNVEVPSEMFGKKPSGWVTRWANFGHPEPPRDQCAFRRRLLLAFTVKGPAVGVVEAFLLLISEAFHLVTTAFLVLGLGFTKPDWGVFLHPMEAPVWHESDSVADDCFFLQAPARALLSPFVLAVGMVMSLLFVSGLWSALVVALCFVGLVGAVALAVSYAAGAWEWWQCRDPKRREPEGLEAVVCTGERPNRKERSVRLRYADLKARVCKPYALDEGE